MKKIDRVYVNAVCVSNEPKLIGKERFLRMADSDSIDSAYAILRETNFGDGQSFPPEQFEQLIYAEQIALNKFLIDNAPQSECIAFCLYENDFFNALSLLRCKYQNISDVSKYINPQGFFPIQTLQNVVDGKNQDGVPTQLINAVQSAKALIEGGTVSGVLLDTIFINAKYQCLLNCVKTAYLRDILVHEIDFLNISTALRSKNYELMQKMFIGGGKLSKEQLKILCGEDYDKMPTLFVGNEYHSYIVKAVNELKKGKPLVDYEKESYDYAIKTLLKTKYQPTGFKPYILYYYYRKNQISNVRIVLTGKLNRLDNNEIKRRLKTV